MKIREYQLDKIDEARALQQECLRLHLPCPPVLHWAYEITAADGEVVEMGRGKANSYTRNALNLLAWNVGLCASSLLSTTSFADGYINYKSTSGAMDNSPYRYANASTTYDPQIRLGISTAEESLDSYKWPVSGLTMGANVAASVFNSTTRKLVTSISRPFTNASGSSIDITEAGIGQYQGSSVNALMVRDAFSAIAVANGQTIVWTYTTEVAYPNP